MQEQNLTDPAPLTPPPLPSSDSLALNQAIARLAHAQACGRPWALAEAYRQTAGCYLRVGALGQATLMLEHGLTWAQATGGADQQLDLVCELVEVLAMQAAVMDAIQRGGGAAVRTRAKGLIHDAARLAGRAADPGWEVTVLLRLSDVLDRFGDRDEATRLQMRALELTMGGGRTPCWPSAEDADTSCTAH